MAGLRAGVEPGNLHAVPGTAGVNVRAVQEQPGHASATIALNVDAGERLPGCGCVPGDGR